MTFIQANYHGGGDNLPIHRLVVHATNPGLGYPKSSEAGMAVSTANYFAHCTTGSAHHIADIKEMVDCLPDSTVAYHAPPNVNSLGYEICADGGEVPADYSRDQWLSPQVWPAVVITAHKVRADAEKYGIPKKKLGPRELLAGEHGICGHVDVSNAWHQTDHTDPGPNFPWNEFMAIVTGDATNTGGSEASVLNKGVVIKAVDGRVGVLTIAGLNWVSASELYLINRFLKDELHNPGDGNEVGVSNDDFDSMLKVHP